MKAPSGAKIEVTITIDPDQWEAMKSQGLFGLDLEKAIKKAITLTESNIRQPVMDIADVHFIRYF